METAMNGYGENTATFACAAKVEIGVPVMVTANGTVAAASGVFCGVTTSWRDGFAGVQLAGYVSLPYSGTKPAVGYQTLTAADGKVQTVPSGTTPLRLVVAADDKNVGFIL